MNAAEFDIIPLGQIVADGEHARLGCSSPRWRKCPGSVREEAEYPNISGAAAIDGTGSHLLLELLLIQWKQTGERPFADEYLNCIIGEGHDDKPDGWLVKQDRCDRVEMALCYIERRLDETGMCDPAYLAPEQRSYPGRYLGRKDWWGTADVTLYADGVIEIMDYKDGRGYVSEKDNKQLMDYAFGMMMDDLLKVPGCYHTVRMTIIQPKTKTPIRYEEKSVDEIIAHAKQQKIAADLTDNPDAPLIAGDHCHWCLHKADCNARTEEALEGMKLMTDVTAAGGDLFQTLSTGQIAPKDMTDDQIAQLLDAAPLITSLLDQVNKEAMSRIDAGQSIPGYAIGKGKGSKKWAGDTEQVEKWLKGLRVPKTEIFPTALISPAQALKLTRLSDRQRERIEKEMITVVMGKPTIKKAVEQREAASADQMFADVTTKAIPQKKVPAKKAPAKPTISFL